MSQYVFKTKTRKDFIELIMKNERMLYVSILSEDDYQSVIHSDLRIDYIGLPGIDEDREKYYFYLSRINNICENVTFSRLLTSDAIIQLRNNNCVIYNKNAEIPSKDTVILVDEGEDTVSKILQLVSEYPNNPIIDARIGDLIEDRQFCQDVDLNVSVVLTAFKRVDSLRTQIEAIKRQTLKPFEILLFQDKVPDNYTIKINEEIINEFDDVLIAQENMGVWERFNFARNAKSKYVCIFDDDTIPGDRWLENCHYNMQEEQAVYGTLGIIISKYGEYPYRGHSRVGWGMPNNSSKEVDFVGHSWFFEKKWLEYMFSDTLKYKEYKYAAEDMSISFACQLHGIKTIVPEHPVDDKRLWGSQPSFGTELGSSSPALSKSGNMNRMKEAMQQMEDDGWNLLYKREYDSVIKYQRYFDLKMYERAIKNKLKVLGIGKN